MKKRINKNELGAVTFYGPKGKHMKVADFYRTKYGISFNTELCKFVENYYDMHEAEIDELDRTLTEMFLNEKESK